MIQETRTRESFREGASSGESFSVSHLFHTLKRYLSIIALSLVAVMVLYMILGLAMYLLAPTQRTTTLPFRLEFAGAESKRYPNGVQFSTSDIINAPILARVYAQNDLQRFMSPAQFQQAIFIVESNSALDSLMRKYAAKLNDPKLSTVDRERIEREWDLKMQSLNKNDYSINFLRQERVFSIPQSVVNKSLTDTLQAFAEQAMKDRGGLDFRIPVVSPTLFSEQGTRPEHAGSLAIATDILRTRIGIALRIIDGLLQIPGAEVLRTPDEKITLIDIRGRFEDILRFQVQPLANQLRPANTGENPAVVRNFLRSQLQYNQLRAEEARRKKAVLEGALATYLEERRTASSSEASADRPSNSGGTGEPVRPQVSENFIDRIVQLSARSADMAFRQKAVTEIVEQSLESVPYESEVTYYKQIFEDYAAAGGPAIPAAQARLALSDSEARSLAAVKLLVEIHQILSNNLNPGRVMYSVTRPPSEHRERTISLSKLLLYGILTMAIALPLIIAGCLIHNRIREEDEADDSQVEPETSLT